MLPHRQKRGAQEPNCPPKEERGSCTGGRGGPAACPKRGCAPAQPHIQVKALEGALMPKFTCFTRITMCNAMHAQGAGHGGGSRSASPSPGSVAELVAAGQGRGSRSTSPPLPSGQTNSFVGPGEVGDATSTRGSPEPAAGVEGCHGSSKVQSNIRGNQTTSVQDLQGFCLSSLMGRGGCGRELLNLSGLPCVGTVSGNAKMEPCLAVAV